MEAIDKASLLSGLLRARGRYKRARSQTRPFIAYEISLLRKSPRHGHGTARRRSRTRQKQPGGHVQDFEEYTKQVQTWMPHSFVSLGGMEAENTKGAVKALQDVILRYPKIVDDDRGIRTFSTAWGFVKMSTSKRKRWLDAVQEIIDREKLHEKVPNAVFEQIQSAEEEFGTVPQSSRISYGAASRFAARVEMIGVHLVMLPKVRKALSTFPIIR